MQSKKLPLDKVVTTEANVKLSSLLDEKCDRPTSSRTCKLWIQYFYLVYVLRLFIEAERTCNCNLHLDFVRKMLRLFHVVGHISYSRYAHLYIQQMENFPDEQSAEEFKKFTKKGHYLPDRKRPLKLTFLFW